MKVVVLLVALLAVLGHAWLSHETGKDRLERLLEESLRSELGGEAEFRGVDVKYDYLDGVLTGELPNEDLQELVQAFAEERRMAGRIASEIKLGPPPDQPAALAVDFDGGRFRMSGKLPDDFSRSAVEDGLRLLGLGKVVDEVEISTRVIPPEWDGAASRVIEDFFREPGPGRLEIAGGEVRLKRKFAGGLERRMEILATADPLRKLGLKVIDQLEVIRDQPADVTAVRTGDGRVTLSGRLGDAAERDRLVAPLRPLLAGPAEAGEVKLDASVVPAEWAGAWGGFLAEFMKGILAGEATVEGSTVVLKGQLPGSKGKGDWVAKAKAAIGVGCEVEDHLTLVPDLEPALSLSVERGQVRIAGTLPAGTLAGELAEAVKQAGFEQLENQVKVSSAVKPPQWSGRLQELAMLMLQNAAKGLQPASLTAQPPKLVVRAIVPRNEDRDALLALARASVPAAWTVEPAVEVKSMRSALMAGDVKPGGGSLRGVLPPRGMLEELRAFAQARPGLGTQLSGEPDVGEPSWKAGELGPFLQVFFSEVATGSFELGEKGWVLAGTVGSEEAKRRILAAAEQLAGPGMPLRDGLRVALPAQPFQVVALQVPGGWKLSGRVPDEATRQALRTALPAAPAAPGTAVAAAAEGADPLAVGMGAGMKPPEWLPRLPGFLRETGVRLTEARISVEEAKLTLEGKHRKVEGKDELTALAKATFGPGMVIEDKTWVPKTEALQAPRVRLALGQDRVTLAGDVGDAAAAQALAAGARAALPKAALVNELRVSPEFAAAAWAPLVGGFLPSFAAVTADGQIEVEKQQITLRGKVRDTASRDALLANFAKALPNDLTLRDEMQALQQPSATDRADTFTLYFNSASSFINPKARQALTAASAAIRAADKNRKSTVLIKGYADVLGDDVSNLELSRERARQVYRELVGSGIDPKQLEFIGVGEAESRARSRFDLRYDRKVEIKLVR